MSKVFMTGMSRTNAVPGRLTESLNRAAGIAGDPAQIPAPDGARLSADSGAKKTGKHTPRGAGRR